MDNQEKYESIKKLNDELLKTFTIIKQSDEEFLKRITPQNDIDIEKSKDIITYMEGLFQTTQTYFRVIESMNHELKKRS